MTVVLEMESAVNLFPLAKGVLKIILPGTVQDIGPETYLLLNSLFIAGSSLVLQKHFLLDLLQPKYRVAFGSFLQYLWQLSTSLVELWILASLPL